MGQSLGINNIPAPKRCSYACVYCQVGYTVKMAIQPAPLYEIGGLYEEVSERVEKIEARGEKIDYITFVADGEPTLDINLGREIGLLRQIGIPIAVISNASLIYQQGVREGLMKADWVSLKVDAVDEGVWRRVNRPHGQLRLSAILDGILEFSRSYCGHLVTETMLVKGVNDNVGGLERTSSFLGKVKPKTAYISVPTRPPTEKWVMAPDDKTIVAAYHAFKGHLDSVELLIGYEGNAFSIAGDAGEDILGIASVHPLRDDALASILDRLGLGWDFIDRLKAENRLAEVSYGGHTFYLRKARPR